MAGCQVGGIWASPGLGRIVADIVSGTESLPAAAFKNVRRQMVARAARSQLPAIYEHRLCVDAEGLMS